MYRAIKSLERAIRFLKINKGLSFEVKKDGLPPGTGRTWGGKKYIKGQDGKGIVESKKDNKNGLTQDNAKKDDLLDSLEKHDYETLNSTKGELMKHKNHHEEQLKKNIPEEKKANHRKSLERANSIISKIDEINKKR